MSRRKYFGRGLSSSPKRGIMLLDKMNCCKEPGPTNICKEVTPKHPKSLVTESIKPSNPLAKEEEK
jgi:hypothetical protein